MQGPAGILGISWIDFSCLPNPSSAHKKRSVVHIVFNAHVYFVFYKKFESISNADSNTLLLSRFLRSHEKYGKSWSFPNLEKSGKKHFLWSVSMEKGNIFPDLIFSYALW